MNGPGDQSQNFGIDGGNVWDQMHSSKLCRKLIFWVPRQVGSDQVFWVATQQDGRPAVPNAHGTPVTRTALYIPGRVAQPGARESEVSSRARHRQSF